MATNRTRWVKNLYGPHITAPLIVPGLFQAGSTQAIKRGEILEKTAGGATQWVPMDSDYAMANDVAIAAEEIKAGDFAGYYGLIVPRPGDVFEYELDASDDLPQGQALYWVNSEKVTDSVGANIVGHVVAGGQYAPIFPQGHASDDASLDKGTTLDFQTFVHMTFRAATSFYGAFQK